MILKRAAIFALVLMGGSRTLLPAQEKRAIQPADCVTVRYLNVGEQPGPLPIAISPDGNRVAYLVKTPELTANRNDIQLYVKNITEDSVIYEPPILVGELSRLKWLKDGRHLTVLMNKDGKHMVEQVDANTGVHETVVKVSGDIVEYDSDSAGDVFVFGVGKPRNQAGLQPTQQEIASGYRISLTTGAEVSLPHTSFFVVKRIRDTWSPPKPLVIRSPFSHQLLTSLTVIPNSYMSLSPDGKDVLIQYQDEAQTLPTRWQEDRFVEFMHGQGSIFKGTKVLVLYHIDNGATTVPFETPFVASVPLWSSDSRTFVAFAEPPVGSEWANQESQNPRVVAEKGIQLFWVRPSDGKIELVASHDQAPYAEDPPLNWTKEGLLVGGLDNVVRRFLYKNDQWELQASMAIPIEGYSTFVSDGSVIVGDMQSPTTPPTLFTYRFGDSTVKVFAKLNPQFDNLALANVEIVNWETSTGLGVRGTLFLPPNAVKGKRYPLVIQTKPYDDWFVCDQGEGHFPSFAPQPLASAGIASLGFYFPDNHDGKGLADYYPKGYPGGIAEAALQTDIYDTAVETLADKGLVDRDNVGIIGFSRSGWFTEFALVHGKTHYRAATVADNVSYSFLEYSTGSIAGVDSKSVASMFGGPPYGATLKNWIDYSISFNLDKINTPLLMETMGRGNLFDHRLLPPFTLTLAFEVFTGLDQLHKPVELYYYPKEEHQPDHPQARLSDLQRNVDWYRFWLQGYERANPEDPDQYVRWRRLRDEQKQDAVDKSTTSLWHPLS